MQDLKRSIIDDGLSVVVNNIIIPHSGWDPTSAGETCWSTIFRNASGVLRYAFSLEFDHLYISHNLTCWFLFDLCKLLSRKY